MEITEELTIPKLFHQKATRYGDGKVAMREKEFGIWRPYTWSDYLEKVKYIALGLDLCKKVGGKSGDDLLEFLDENGRTN